MKSKHIFSSFQQNQGIIAIKTEGGTRSGTERKNLMKKKDNKRSGFKKTDDGDRHYIYIFEELS